MRSGYQFNNTLYPAWDYFQLAAVGGNTWNLSEAVVKKPSDETWCLSSEGPCTGKGLLASAEFGEWDAEAGPDCLGIAKFMKQAAGRKKTGEALVPALLAEVCVWKVKARSDQEGS